MSHEYCASIVKVAQRCKCTFYSWLMLCSDFSRPSGDARVSGAKGIDILAPSPPLPLEVGALEVGPLKPSYRGLRSAVSSLNGVWVEVPAANDFGAF